LEGERPCREKWPDPPAEKRLDLSHEEGIEGEDPGAWAILDDILGSREQVASRRFVGEKG
jgi:hypothetical protein